MEEATWQRCDDPKLMLDHLRDAGSPRKLRLFASACCRRVLHLDKKLSWGMEGTEPFVTALELHAEQLMTEDEWADVVKRVLHKRDAIYTETCDMLEADFCTIYCAIDNDASDAAEWAALNANIALSNFAHRPYAKEAAGSPEACHQTALLRDIFGNPFRAATLDSSWLSWRESTIPRLAQAIYEERQLPSGNLDATKLLILADALAEAGADGDILDHLRRPEPHVRGCHVIDLVLGKE